MNKYAHCLNILYKKILSFKGPLDFSPEEVVTYVQTLELPKDNIERSYSQYKCFCHTGSFTAVLLLNLITWPLFFVVLFRGLLCLKPKIQKGIDALDDSKDWINECLPLSLRKEFPSRLCVNWNDKSYLDSKDLLYLSKIFIRHPFSGWFLFKVFHKISKYSYFIKKYSPKAILVHGEYSFTSSILTEYCNHYNILHIDYQHGERFFDLRCPFFHYDRCYVWDAYYIELYNQLNAYNIYFVELPPSIIIDTQKNGDNSVYKDVKYYLSIINSDQAEKLSWLMKEIEGKGLSWCIRPHPRYTDMSIIRQYFDNENIERGNVTIEKSICNSKYSVSVFSTVLFQAYHVGKQILIDDVVFKEQYTKLNGHYIMLLKEHNLLSRFIEEN